MQMGILVVSFGTTHKETRIKNIDTVFNYIKNRYPEALCYQAFSSDCVRKILKNRDGLNIFSVEEALEQMKADNITHVYVQLTHVIDGIETNRIKKIIEEYKNDFERMEVGEPLLESELDIETVGEYVWKELSDIVGEDTLIMMGHGTVHEADSVYGKLEKAIRKVTSNPVYICTVEGETTIDDVIEKLEINKKSNQKTLKINLKSNEKDNLSNEKIVTDRVVLAPLMLVAGDHVINDMMGSEDSFKSKLIEAGYKPECIIKGLGEYTKIKEIYLEHLQNKILSL